MSPRRIALRSRLPQVLLLATVTLLASAGAAHGGTVENPPKPRAEFACESGEFCAWTGELYLGDMTRFDLRNTTPEECVPLPRHVSAKSFANRIDRHVTVYQDRNCATEGDFSTYPGPGTFVPDAPYVVRAMQIWN